MEKKLEQEFTDCIKVVLFGPESTGKTTISKQLAKHYNTVWVPEYMREYLQNKWDNKQKTCEPNDLLPIAKGQMQLENKLAKKANKVLICDTDLLETKVYSEAYYSGTCDPILDKYALKNTYHLYFLTYIDTPWEADDLRDKPNDRLPMFKAFENTLKKHNRPYVLLKGNKKERLKTAIKHIDKLLNDKALDFTEKDQKQIEAKGLTPNDVNSQINRFKAGLPYTKLNAAATLNNGILKVNAEEKQRYINLFEEKLSGISVVKFVPASGAATRMFQFLFQFLIEYHSEKETIAAFIERTHYKELKVFFEGLKNLAFYDEVLAKVTSIYPNYNSMSQDEKHVSFVKTMLGETAFNFGNKPKGLLSFHNYKSHITTAFEEHLFESTLYASSNSQATLHYTISEHHKDKFESKLASVKSKIENETGVVFNISFSFQKPSTDTIAVTLNNEPFRLEDGSLHFRPSGHGALIENLSAIDADVVFIKNIDNVVIFQQAQIVADYKKMLAGILLTVQEQSFNYLEKLDYEETNEALVLEIAQFLTSKMCVVLNEDFDDFSLTVKAAYLKEKLNRPIRICGMVKNEGAPGGGPFWVEDTQGNVSLQVVETAQINQKDSAQKKILSNATHFNPVDLACGLKNYKGIPFNLPDFVDEKAAFITQKTKDGKDIKALERPGLWNGSMANWNTIFVEVPLATFTPVKTVNDLLKPQHQAS